MGGADKQSMLPSYQFGKYLYRSWMNIKIYEKKYRIRPF